MCDCIEKKNKEIIEHVTKEKAKEGKAVLPLENSYGLGLQNVAFPFNEGEISSPRPYIEFEYEYTFVKKNGERSGVKKQSVNIFPTYCCFCGKKIGAK